MCTWIRVHATLSHAHIAAKQSHTHTYTYNYRTERMAKFSRTWKTHTHIKRHLCMTPMGTIIVKLFGELGLQATLTRTYIHTLTYTFSPVSNAITWFAHTFGYLTESIVLLKHHFVLHFVSAWIGNEQNLIETTTKTIDDYCCCCIDIHQISAVKTRKVEFAALLVVLTGILL